MDYLPINISIKGLKILIVGGGQVAYQKLKALIKHTNNIEVLAPEICQDILALEVTKTVKEFEVSDLENAHLVYAATNKKRLNEQIAHECKKKTILVNVVDNPKLSGFISLATFYYGKHTISIGSDGKSPRDTVKLRNKIAFYLKGND